MTTVQHQASNGDLQGVALHPLAAALSAHNRAPLVPARECAVVLTKAVTPPPHFARHLPFYAPPLLPAGQAAAAPRESFGFLRGLVAPSRRHSDATAFYAPPLLPAGQAAAAKAQESARLLFCPEPVDGRFQRVAGKQLHRPQLTLQHYGNPGGGIAGLHPQQQYGPAGFVSQKSMVYL